MKTPLALMVRRGKERNVFKYFDSIQEEEREGKRGGDGGLETSEADGKEK